MTVSGTSASRRAFLPFAPPTVGSEEIAEVVDTLRSPWITTGPKTRRFEEEFAAFVGAEAAVAVNSCTAALHTALACLGAGQGDEVITTPLTFAATVNVIEHVGARPILVDVEPDTLNIDPDRLAAAITPQTRAVIPVHFAGHPVELEPIRALAREKDIAVVEDAAHSLPAAYAGRRIGAAPSIAAFSFYATKNLTTGEGGMLTGPRDVVDRARIMALHGMSRDAWRRYEQGATWRYDIVAPGFKYNMTDIQASLGLWQLKKQDAFLARRRDVAAAYTRAFAASEALETPVTRDNVAHAWHLYVLRLRPHLLRIDRDRFIEELAARNIGTSVHFIPVHTHPYYRTKYDYAADAFPVAYGNYQRLLSLPLHPRLSDQDVADVIEAVLDVVATHRR
jgi:dTDP-4-amino-4,6-dideoxygalactose transaminase